MKKIMAICSMIIVLLLSGCGSLNKEGTIDKISYKETTEKTNYIKIEMTTGKIMLLELYPDIAPITVENFQKLVSEKFYDNLTFHRISKGFVIQGGDPTGTGTGGSEKTIKGEFESNGIENSLSHERGVISMARSGARQNATKEELEASYNSASSQFFICLGDASFLDGEYAAFGKVIAGYDTLDKIASTTTSGETPTTKQTMKSIRFVTIEK